MSVHVVLTITGSDYGVEVITAAVDFSAGRSAVADSHLEDILKDLEIGVLVNSVGMDESDCSDHPHFFDEVSI